MARQDYEVRVPKKVYDACTETKEDQFWTDDRGFTYAVSWSDSHKTALAAVVDVPPGESAANAWHRDTPQPEVIEH